MKVKNHWLVSQGDRIERAEEKENKLLFNSRCYLTILS